MARPGLTQHRKFLRLARVIGSAPLALGLLEFMWERCYQNGEPYLGDETDVEAAANWSGEPGALAKAFLEAGGTGNPGFIDEDPDRPGNYLCHDLFDHAPDYVAGRRKKEQERQRTKVCACCGGIFHSPDLRAKFCTDACKQKDWRNRHSPENGNALPTVTDKSVTVTECYGNALPTVTDSYCTPAPAPAPITDLGEVSPNTPLPRKKRSGKTLGDYSPEFESASAIWKRLFNETFPIRDSLPVDKVFASSSWGSKSAGWEVWKGLRGQSVNGSGHVEDKDLLEVINGFASAKLQRAKDGIELNLPLFETMLRKPRLKDALVEVVKNRKVQV